MLTGAVPAPVWLALAGLAAVTALPSPAWVRAAGLGAAGRLAAPGAGRAQRRVLATAGRGASAVGAAGAAGLGGGWVLGGVPVSVGLGAGAAVVALLGRDAVRGRRGARHRRALLAAMRLLLADLDAGADPARALGAAGELCPGRPELAEAARVAHAGRDAAAVLQSAADPHVRALGLAWRLGAATGSALSEVLGRVADDLAEVDAQRRAVTVAVAGPKASAVLLSGLPALGLLLGAAMGAHPLQFLLAGASGRVVCGAGLLLDAAGLYWIRCILRRAEQ